MIENFSLAQFAAALPPVGGTPWKQAGTDNGQIIFTVQPAGCRFGLLCWSSIDPQTLCSKAGAGYDSIRAVCCKFKDSQGCTVAVPFGGKTARWTDRRPGWQRRLRAVLTTLAQQLKAIIPCPHCGTDTVPLTCKQGDNKGRPFVACTDKACPGKTDGKAFGFFQWADNPPKTAQDERKPAKEGQGSLNPSQSTGAPATTPEMATCKCGQACKVFTSTTAKNPGRKFINCRNCGEFQWVDQGCTVEAPRKGIGLEEAKREQGQQWAQGGEAQAMGMAAAQGCTVTPPSNAHVDPRNALRNALRFLDAGNVEQASMEARRAAMLLGEYETLAAEACQE